MKIVSSQLELQSTHRQRMRYSKSSRLQIWREDRFAPEGQERGPLRRSRAQRPLANALVEREGGRAPLANGPTPPRISKSAASPVASSSPERAAEELSACAQEEAIPSITGDAELDGELLVFALVIARMTGRSVYISRLGAQLSEQMSAAADRCIHLQPHASDGQADLTLDQEPLSFRYEEESEWSEHEELEFSAAGTVCLADGRQINLELEMNLERSYLSEELRVVESRPLKDPLIFDLGATAAQFTGEHVRFDIDADGHLDLLPTLDESGAFLTLDQNGDGEINDGGELIGAISGDGFQELRALDEDENGWLDEGDEVFERLSLWRWSADGEAQILGLAEVGVGAIYLGAIDASFEHRNQAQERVAQQRAASLYLKNSGEAGSIRQVDVAG